MSALDREREYPHAPRHDPALGDDWFLWLVLGITLIGSGFATNPMLATTVCLIVGAVAVWRYQRRR